MKPGDAKCKTREISKVKHRTIQMKQNDLHTEQKKGFFEGRAVMAGVIAVTVFLCLFTAFELFVIKMEWNLPVMHVFISGSDNYIFSQYREEEEKLEQSTENVVADQSDAAGNKEAGDADEGMATDEGKNTEETANKGENVITEESVNTGAFDNTEDSEIEEELQADETEKLKSEEDASVQEEEPLPYYIKINRKENVVTIYEKDEQGEYTIPVRAILCSTGLYDATPKGVFHLSSKYVWRLLNGGVYGQYASRITGGVLFHSVPYSSKNKATLYTDKYNKLGEQASMGCVRLTVEDAKWIYDNCPSGTAVEIYDSEDPGPLGKPEGIKIDKDSPNKGWDPTDPDERNPWHAWSEDE